MSGAWRQRPKRLGRGSAARPRRGGGRHSSGAAAAAPGAPRRGGAHGRDSARLRRGDDGRFLARRRRVHPGVATRRRAWPRPCTAPARRRWARPGGRHAFGDLSCDLRVTREDGAAAVDEREERVDLLAANGEHPALLPPEQGADEREVVVHAHAGGEQHALHDGVDPHDVLVLVQVQQAEGHVEQDAEHGRRKTRRGRADASHLDLGTTLIFTALYNFASGLLFGIPMPVQPMKSIAAVALSSAHLTIPQIMSAGVAVAAILLFLGATGLMTCLYRVLPLPVVRGVQLSQGLSFAFTAVKYIRYDQDFSQSSTASTSVQRSLIGLDGLLLAFAALLFILLATGSGDDDDVTNDRAGRRRSCGRVPTALIVFALALVLCFVRDPSIFGGLRFGPAPLGLVKLTWDDFKIGFWQAAVPQLPLSVLNSVIAVCKLSSDLFPEQAELSPARVSISGGLMNLVGCWFGAMPCCHGAGGLAGQYRFGGRSGASVVFLAIGKLLPGLVFGNSFVTILGKFPIGILGVMLLFSGVELAMASRDMRSKEESFVMLVCAGVSLIGSSSALGFIAGIVLHLLLRLREVDYRELVGRFSSCSWTGRGC